MRGEVWRSLVELAGVGLAALLVGLTAAWLLAGWLPRPLRSRTRDARRVSRGELDHRAQVEGSTEQRELAEAFNDMTERLGRALTAQRELVANASQQLRAPLTGLRLRLESAGVRTEDAALRRDIEEAEAEAERLSALLTDLLPLVSGTERAGRAADVPMVEAAEAARERWAAPAERSGIRLVVDPGPDLRARTSREDLGVVLDHLVDSAIKYGHPGARVTLAWGSEGPDRVRLTVTDQAPGLGEEERSRAFARGWRTGPAAESAVR